MEPLGNPGGFQGLKTQETKWGLDLLAVRRHPGAGISAYAPKAATELGEAGRHELDEEDLPF